MKKKIFSADLAEIRTADLVHDLSSVDDDLNRSTTMADLNEVFLIFSSTS